ncbi:copper resistance protein NlpE N-terminal domain-containing protein [Eleftheria terrae]|uniref:copper resistance protein NlpE N-terminal domain-containing protein n=1 Tax=Eleftheria terrae TaxID=1597781 RepID=UPI00263BDDBB|nr:copper resistance protein NlpE N-terminal domain-containing protein [Eleftheria terrae]WKB52380.1 copper resistance protein NlpE N-terminal domain-containing protein [Eleftheria terrae]
MISSRLLPAFAAAAVLAGCASWRSGEPPIGHTAPDGATPVARYVGTLPCTDCAGVRTDLQLYANAAGLPARYSLNQTFLAGKEGNRRTNTTGNWLAARGSSDDAQAQLLHIDPDHPERARIFQQQSPQVLRALGSDGNEMPASVPRSLVRVPDGVPPSALVLTYADRGSDAEVKPGQQVVLLLASQPSSGYHWAAKAEGLAAMAPQGEPVHVADPTPNGAGLDMFRFKAAGSGTQVLRLEYRSASAEPVPKVIDVATFNIRVR